MKELIIGLLILSMVLLVGCEEEKAIAPTMFIHSDNESLPTCYANCNLDESDCLFIEEYTITSDCNETEIEKIKERLDTFIDEFEEDEFELIRYNENSIDGNTYVNGTLVAFTKDGYTYVKKYSEEIRMNEEQFCKECGKELDKDEYGEYCSSCV